MTCKLNPEVFVKRVVLASDSTVVVEAEITNYDNRDILLEGCINVVCILALSNTDAETIRDSLDAQEHWDKESWYDDQDNSISSHSVVKSPSGSDIVLTLPLTSNGAELTEQDYLELDDLYVFTYLQINKKRLAAKYATDLDKTPAISGWWRVGIILEDGDHDGSSWNEFQVQRHGPNGFPASSDDGLKFDINDYRDGLTTASCSNDGDIQ
jgi:hypothetical protein